jgi:hypothetical protein
LRRTMAVVLVCVSALIAGGLATGMPVSRLLGVSSIERAGETNGLALTVQSTVWSRRDQLEVEVKVQNRGAITRVLGPDDFALEARGSQRWPPRSHTFAIIALAPREYLHGVLTFDELPETATDLQLVWTAHNAELTSSRADVGTTRRSPAVRVAIDARASSTTRPSRWARPCLSPSPWCP